MSKTNLGYWGVDYDYERSQCTCDPDEYICRCTKIISTEIEKVNAQEVVNHLIETHIKKQNVLLKYCFDRLCYYYEVYDKELYWVETCGGYYGGVIEGVYFDNEEKVLEEFDKILNFNSDVERIQYLLKLEYGYLLEEIKDKNFVLAEVINANQLVIPQREHYMKLDKKAVENYKDRELPLGVCVLQNNNYRLIDGYHRVSANQDLEKVSVIVIK